MAEVIDGIFIGGIDIAKDKKWLTDNNIQHILNLSENTYESAIPVTHIHITDENIDRSNISEFMKLFKKTLNCINNKRILVHCMLGVNRSAAVIIFYLINNGHSYDAAKKLVIKANKSRNSSTLDNHTFDKLLYTIGAFLE